MRFRVTSVAGSEQGVSLNDVTVKFEDQLNSLLGSMQFGSNIEQFSLVVVSVYDEPDQNEAFCEGHRKLATSKNPFTGETTRYLSVAVPLPPQKVIAAKGTALEELVVASIVKALAKRPSRLPAGLDFRRLSAAVNSTLTGSAT